MFQSLRCTRRHEGVFGQQLDDNPYIVPNYDAYLFEVATGRWVKRLHELQRGEWGRLIVFSCMLPRYDMGDLFEAAGKGYFRIFGRNNTATCLEHRLYRALCVSPYNISKSKRCSLYR
jgi:hypothetical protein